MDGTEAQINFDAPAVLRKWPSLQNQRRIDDFSPYLLLQSTLDECLRVLMKKPAGTLHLYEIHTAPQPPLVEGSAVWRACRRTRTAAGTRATAGFSLICGA
jgi:hypothetical protein